MGLVDKDLTNKTKEKQAMGQVCRIVQWLSPPPPQITQRVVSTQPVVIVRAKPPVVDAELRRWWIMSRAKPNGSHLLDVANMPNLTPDELVLALSTMDPGSRWNARILTKLKNAELWQEAFRQDPSVYIFMPEAQKQSWMVEPFLDQCHDPTCVPEKHQDHPRWAQAVVEGNMVGRCCIPDYLWSFALADRAATLDPTCLRWIPTAYRTPDMFIRYNRVRENVFDHLPQTLEGNLLFRLLEDNPKLHIPRGDSRVTQVLQTNPSWITECQDPNLLAPLRFWFNDAQWLQLIALDVSYFYRSCPNPLKLRIVNAGVAALSTNV